MNSSFSKRDLLLTVCLLLTLALGGLVLTANRSKTASAPLAKKEIEDSVPVNPLASALDWLARQPSFSVVQLGAYIGNSPNDPLYPFFQKVFGSDGRLDPSKSSIVLVEPMKEYFDQLQKSYENIPGVKLANVCIAESDGIRDFYTLKVDPTKYGYPAWLSQLSSLKPERMGKLWDEYENNPDYKRFYLEHREVEKVQCITLGRLLDEHQIKQLDLLQIDVEGYDCEIIKSMDFTKTKPRFINYERVLLTPEEKEQCRKLLEAQGYLVIDWHTDTFCALVR